MSTEKFNAIINIIKYKKFSCKIDHYIIPEARLQMESGQYYICQDQCPGIMCKDKLGYLYSWQFTRGNLSYLSEIEIIEDNSTVDNYLIFT